MELEKNIAEFANKIEIVNYLLVNTLKNKSIFDEDCNVSIRKIDGNLYNLYIKTLKSEIIIKILQILETVSIYFVLEPQRFYSLKISLKTFFAPKLRNTYNIDKLDIYFKKGAKKKLIDLFEIRIINKFKNKKKWNFNEIDANLLLKIVAFLDLKSLWGLIRVSQEINKRFFENNEFWYSLYESKFKKTGFKLNFLNWKLSYINEMKKRKK